MALSKSFQKGQTILACQMCEEESKIKWKCLLCNLFMCDKCRKIHQKVKSTEEHKIVDLKNIAPEQDTSGQIPNFNNIKCDKHSGKICCLFCTECEEVVCPLCIANAHNKHNMVEMSEGFELATKVLDDIYSKTNHDIQKSAKNIGTLQWRKTEEQSIFSSEKQKILSHEKILKDLVHKQSDKLLNDLDQRWNVIKQKIQDDEIKVQSEHDNLNLRYNILKKAKDANNSEKVFKTVEKESRMSKSAIKEINVTKYRRVPSFIPAILTEQSISSIYGSLAEVSDQSVLFQSKFQVLKQCTTGLPGVHCIASCSDDGSLWIGSFNSNKIQNIMFPRDNLISIKNTLEVDEIVRMKMSCNGNLYMSVSKSNLSILVAGTRNIMPTNYTVAPLITKSAFHITKNNKIIVAAREQGPALPPKGPRKVIVMKTNGDHEMTYFLDNNKKPLFTCPVSITTDNINDIYVIDMLNVETTGRVVKLNKVGGVSLIYTGNPKINDTAHPFTPADLTTSLSNNIIIADDLHSVLHIMNTNLQCIHFVKTDEELGITWPISLEIDNRGILFIGCEADQDKSNAKIYEVKISGV